METLVVEFYIEDNLLVTVFTLHPATPQTMSEPEEPATIEIISSNIVLDGVKVADCPLSDNELYREINSRSSEWSEYQSKPTPAEKDRVQTVRRAYLNSVQHLKTVAEATAKEFGIPYGYFGGMVDMQLVYFVAWFPELEGAYQDYCRVLALHREIKAAWFAAKNLWEEFYFMGLYDKKIA